MLLENCLTELGKYRKNEVVVACESSSHVWNSVSNNHNLDIYFEDCMGKGSSLGLGIALAKPTSKVIVLDGDGSLLMNLGSLATVSEVQPENFIHFVVQNGSYAGSGNQPIPSSSQLSFSKMADAGGYVKTFEFDNIEDFTLDIETILNTPGPIFVTLKVAIDPNYIAPTTKHELKDSIELVKLNLTDS